jgi:hypothetical protein
VLESFDLAPCKALARVDAGAGGGGSGALIIEAQPSWVESMRRAAFWTTSVAWSSASVARVLKYVS